MTSKGVILVTGGLGFIGSHITVELVQTGYDVVIVDNLVNSTERIFQNIQKVLGNEQDHVTLYVLDLTRKDDLFDLFHKYKFQAIIHCAGLKAANESIQKPLMYYKENLTMTFHLLELMKEYNVGRFIFSSSATVYGLPKTTSKIFCETDEIGRNITNPYGQTKYMQEQIIQDFAKTVPDKTFILLRYFNPIGAHMSGLLGENPRGRPNNLMPYVLRVAANNTGIGFNTTEQDVKNYSNLTIFGTDYQTRDGTCIRDFIHVVDLAKAHVSSVEFDGFLDTYEPNVETFNIGTGTGTSVLELVTAFQGENELLLNTIYGERREGDPTVVVCDVDKAEKVLGWNATLKVGDMVRDTWNYMVEELHPENV